MILADAGFLYALLDKSDAWHSRALAAAEALEEGLVTTWPVLTEAIQLATRWLGASAAISMMQEAADGDLLLWDLPAEARRKLPTLMKRYANLPMDLADASLVLLAESLGHGRILTTDERDFRSYRWKSRAPFENLLAMY